VRTVADQEEFRDASWRVVADVPRMCGSASQVGTTHLASHCLTSLAPQPPHRPAIECRFPWSQRFDRIFRNEGVTGSNPVSSTHSQRWDGPLGLSTSDGLEIRIGFNRRCAPGQEPGQGVGDLPTAMSAVGKGCGSQVVNEQQDCPGH